MESSTAIAVGTALFLGEVFPRYWVIAKGWEIGRAVAWGVDEGLRLSIAERQHRLWMTYVPFQSYVVLIPLAVMAALLALAQEVTGTNGRLLLYLLAGLEAAAALGALAIGSYWTARMARNVEAGKFGFLGGEEEPDVFGDRLAP